MKDQMVKTKELREPMFSEIFVWLDTDAENFKSYKKMHLMLVLNWGCSKLMLKVHLEANQGDTDRTALVLSDKFKTDFSGNINYLRGILDSKTVDHMIRLIQLFIKESLLIVAEGEYR